MKPGVKKSAIVSAAQRIRESGFFDESYYRRASGQPGNETSLIKHFCEVGWKAGLSPSASFDVRFYLEHYPDVAAAGVNPLVHFLEHGRQELRYPCLARLEEDAALVTASGQFDEARHVALFGMQRLMPLQDYLLNWRRGRTLNEKFNDVFYEEVYRPTQTRGKIPVFDYLERRGNEVIFTTRSHWDACKASLKKGFEKSFYEDQIDRSGNFRFESVDNAIEHYLTEGVNRGLSGRVGFDPQAYLGRYIGRVPTNFEPLTDFVAHGQGAGRSGRISLKEILRSGGRAFNPTLPTLLILNHEASRTGAPLVGLNIARFLGERWNIISYVGADAGLADDFARNSCDLIVGGSSTGFEMLLRELVRGYGLRAVISNSVENQHLTHWVKAVGLPLVSLIHEFSEYTLPVSKSTAAIRLSDRVIVPAHLVEESLQREVQSISSVRAPNIVVRHQGALPYLPKERGTSTALSAEEIREVVAGLGLGQRHIVLGAGHAQPRKGIDLFVQTAGYVARQRDDVAFLWVGSGYHPKSDLQYSLWVDQTIERMGLRKTVLFLPSQPNLDACFEASDLFYLPSRLDPYPNVVIDALMASRDVVCFEGATGCAELFGEDVGFRGAAVPYADVQAAGDAIIRLIDQSPKDDFNAVKAADYFDFDAYLAVIESEIEVACANAAENEAQAQRLIDKALVDRDYYSPFARNSAGAARDYVASSRKGLAPRNPRPGFSENWWRTLNPGNDGICPLSAELDAGNERPITHRCEILRKGAPALMRSLRTALHLHLHFPELASEFAGRLSMADVPVDIFATVTNPKAVQAVEYAFSDYEHGTVQTLLVPNRGRDIGPLLVDLREPLSGYDVVGHLHGKRSLDVGGDVGSRWFNFLADTLIGSDNGVLGQIIGKFENRPDLGLVFAEDAHNVGWSDNWPSAEQLARRTEPKLDLPSHPFFPLGTMFWARRKALQPLWDMNLTRDDLPIEPLPYDGTILHALERILPTACQAAGLNWQTVMMPGASW